MLTVDNGHCKIPEGTECLDSIDFFNGAEDKIEVLSIPGSVKKINPEVFMKLKNLAEFEVSEDNKAFCSQNDALYSKDEKCIIKWPPACRTSIVDADYRFMQEMGEFAFAGCRYLKKISINKYIKCIPKSAFQDCENLSEVILDEEMLELTVSTLAFANCCNLKEIVFPVYTENIERDALKGCKMNMIVLPDRMFFANSNYERKVCGILGIKAMPDENELSIRKYTKYLIDKSVESKQNEINCLKRQVYEMQKGITGIYKELNGEIYDKLSDAKEHYRNGNFEYCRKQLRYALELTINHLCRLYGYDYSGTLSSKMADIKSVFDRAGEKDTYKALEGIIMSESKRSYVPYNDDISLKSENGLCPSSSVKDAFRCFRHYYKTVFHSLHDYAVNHESFDEVEYIKGKAVSIKINKSILEKDILKRERRFKKYNGELKAAHWADSQVSEVEPENCSSVLTLSKYVPEVFSSPSIMDNTTDRDESFYNIDRTFDGDISEFANF